MVTTLGIVLLIVEGILIGVSTLGKYLLEKQSKRWKKIGAKLANLDIIAKKIPIKILFMVRLYDWSGKNSEVALGCLL